MSNDRWEYDYYDEGVLNFLWNCLVFLVRHGITIAAVFLVLIPFMNLLPLELHNFTFYHPFLLVGPLLTLVPVFLAYHIHWSKFKAVENMIAIGGILVFGMVISEMFIFWGLVTGPFICPDGYPFTDFTVVSENPRRYIPLQFADLMCQGDQGKYLVPDNTVNTITWYAYLVSALLCGAVSFFLGRLSRLFGRSSEAGEMHFIRYFVVALPVCIVFLALPQYYSGANFLAKRYEVPRGFASMKDRQIARYSPIHGAAMSGKVEIVKALLKEGANKNAIVNAGLTPLGIAVKRKNARLVRMLVEAGADVNLGEKSKQSAMQLAFEGKNPELIAYLQKKGGNQLAVGKGGSGLLATAVEKLDLEAARKLLKKGANPNILTKHDGQSLLFRTIFEVKTDSYKQPRKGQIRSLEMARLLLEHGANLESRERDGWTPLVFAIREDNIWMVELFMEHGAKIDALDDDGQNPLYHALKGRYFRKDILALLLEKGVKIDHRDKRGRTALITLTQYERSTWPLQWLIRNGADVNKMDKSGQTALDKLKKNYWDDKKRKVLLEAGAKSALTR